MSTSALHKTDREHQTAHERRLHERVWEIERLFDDAPDDVTIGQMRDAFDQLRMRKIALDLFYRDRADRQDRALKVALSIESLSEVDRKRIAAGRVGNELRRAHAAEPEVTELIEHYRALPAADRNAVRRIVAALKTNRA